MNEGTSIDRLKDSLLLLQSRRNVLKGVLAGSVGVGGLALNGADVLAAGRKNSTCVTPIADILNIAVTAERLAVTFYTNAVHYAHDLGLSGDNLDYFKSALIEEQIHESFLESQGATPLTSKFSFPHGPDTFKHIHLLIDTQQHLEGVFDAAYLSAVREFAVQNRPDLAQIAAQIACIEAEHRVLGRTIVNDLKPADNWAFTPILISSVADAPAVLTKARYLSPKKGNSYTYYKVETKDSRIQYREPIAATC